MKTNPRRRGQKGYTPSAREQRREIKESLYKDRAAAMRPYFGDLFKASNGYDLRRPEKWTGAQKAKITKYWRVIAPQIARSHKARFFRNDDHLKEAIAYTQQEAFLPGQRAALFGVEESEKLNIKFSRRGKITVKRQGILVEKVYFDLATFLTEPEQAIADALEQVEGASRYKMIMGPHESKGSYTETQITDAIMAGISKYSDEERYDPGWINSQYYANWLLGIVAYYGEQKEITTFLRSERERRDEEIEARRLEYVTRRRLARRKLTRRARLRMK